VLDGITSLVDKSLVWHQDATNREPRFGMLETIREYALERLRASGETEDVRRRHATWFVALGERAGSHLLRGPDQLGWLARLATEIANLRLALTWLATAGDSGGLRLASALMRFWYLRGPLSEGQSWLEQTLAASRDASPMLRVVALTDLSLLALFQGNHDRATLAIEECEQLVQAAEDRLSLACLRNVQSFLAMRQGDAGQALALAKESVALFEGLEHGGRQNLARLSTVVAALSQGDLIQAKSIAEENLALGRQTGDELGVGSALNHLGWVAIRQDDYTSAAGWFAEALSGVPRFGETWMAAYYLEGLAIAAGSRGDHEAAARLFGAAANFGQSAGFRLPPLMEAHHERAIAGIRTSLGEPAFGMAWASGQTLGLEAVLAEAAALAAATERQPTVPRTHLPSLTGREVEVLRLAAAGLTAPQIADRLFLSPRTVHTHLAAIYRKLGVTTRGEAVRVAIERGLA
jgi:non-specific serine/threonine protein kinase